MFKKLLNAAVIMLLVSIPVTFVSAQPRAHVFRMDNHRDQGWLGVMIEDVSQRLKDRKKLSVDAGAYVTDVTEDSPAEKAGIKEGDVIVKFDDKRIDESSDLSKAVQRTKPKTEVKIEIVRNDEHKTLTATLARERGSAASAYSFRFNDGNWPRMPRMPRIANNFHFSFGNEMYGIEAQDLNDQLAQYFEVPGNHGVLVARVEKGGDGEKAGLKAGDVITKANGNTVRDLEDLREELSESKDNKVPLDVIRKGKSLTITMNLSREDDDSMDEEDDDDASFNLMIPNGCQPHADVLLQSQKDHKQIMDELKDYLLSLRRQLQERIESVSRTLRTSIMSIVDRSERRIQTPTLA